MLEYLIKGKWLMGPLLACSIIAIAVIIDRIRAFRLADSDSFEMRRNVSGLLEDHKIDEAIDECGNYHGPVAAVMLAGLDKLRRLSKLGPLEKRLNLLTLIGMVSPLLGMTGTVTGMIASFGAISQAGGSQTEAAAVGISEALITTAAGLLIALPALVAHNLLAKRMDKFTLEIEETVIELNDYVSLKRGAE